MRVADVIDQGSMAGCAITDSGIAKRRIGSLGGAGQMMNRRFPRNLDVAGKAVCLDDETDDAAVDRLLVAVETAVCAVGYAVIVSVRIGHNRTVRYGLAVEQVMTVAV